MCSIDLEPCSVWDESEVKSARKVHTCDCCGGRIEPGSSYLRHFSVFDGDVTTEKCCASCRAARDEFRDHHGTVGTPGYTMQLLMECWSGESRKYWTEQDRRWRSLYAAMLLRGRAAARSVTRGKGSPSAST